MRTIDIFCDASVGSDLVGACAGALIVERQSQVSQMKAIIQPHGTNNSGEISAVLLGVMSAIDIRDTINEPCRFNIFSDSIFAIKGVREWIFSWISRAVRNKNNIFINASGQPVANQMYFKMVFNNILLYNLDVRFYHQRGHISSNKQFIQANSDFLKNNGIPLMRLGLTIEEISAQNNYVDARSRDILRSFLEHKKIIMNGVEFDAIANTEFERISDGLCIPHFNLIDREPSVEANQQFPFIDNTRKALSKYASLIHLDEFPASSSVSRYIS